MRPRASLAFLGLLLVSALIASSESKLQRQATVEEEEEEDEDDEWDEENSKENNYPSKPEIDDEGRVYKNPRNSPSAQCPRDEEQAEIFGQKCLRKCSTDEDCKSKKKKCRCDGPCGMSCIKPDRECPELMEIERGLLAVSGRLFGDRANYSCDPGYYVVGLAERSCGVDGRWSGITPSCKKDPTSFCTAPHKFPNARHNALPEQATFELDSMVQYYCNHGYVTKGSPKAKCLMTEGAASWYGPDITCEARSCEPPADIANGWHAGTVDPAPLHPHLHHLISGSIKSVDNK
jgi:hypothetical protein